MENTNLETQEENVKQAIRDLQDELNSDLRRGIYYGLDLKIRNIQRALSLSIRV